MRKSLEVAKERFKINDVANFNAVLGVEVGVKSGGNAKTMLKEWSNLKLLHLVDSYVRRMPFYYEEAKVNLKEYENRIVWHVTSSIHASTRFADNSLNFVYIDAGHNPTEVTQDLWHWWPKIRKGGMICGHDYSDPSGVKTAVDIFVEHLHLTLFLGGQNTKIDDSDWWIFKDEN